MPKMFADNPKIQIPKSKKDSNINCPFLHSDIYFFK